MTYNEVYKLSASQFYFLCEITRNVVKENMPEDKKVKKSNRVKVKNEDIEDLEQYL
jgi:hypothetical protein